MRVMVRKEDGETIGSIEFEVMPRSGEWVIIDGVARTVRHVEHFMSSDTGNTLSSVVLRLTDADSK